MKDRRNPVEFDEAWPVVVFRDDRRSAERRSGLLVSHL
jgi:hypothetical protein